MTKKTRLKRRAQAEPTANKVKRRHSGASRVAAPRSGKSVVDFGMALRFLSLVGVGVALTAAFIWFDPKQKIEAFASRPITQVNIESEFRYLGYQEAEEVLSQYVTGSFINLDIAGLKATLENEGWVDKVSISRKWPDKLVVQINEQRPIARWGADGFLNMRGDIVRIEGVDRLNGLPLLSGEDHHARKIMQQYLRAGKLFGQNDMELAAIELDETMAWTLTLAGDVTIKLGRDQLFEKLQALVSVRQGALVDSFTKVQSIDMRYANGFAVAWKDGPGEKLASAAN